MSRHKMSDSVSVQVALRIRPLVESEISKGCVKCLETVQGEPQVLIKDLSFTFNHVFPPEVSQQQFYETGVKDLVQGLFNGYNVTILAYGQTGSGKTHSMGTAYSGGPREDMGVIPRAIQDIFQHTRNNQEEYDFRIQVSFMELYQEQLFDLLSTKHRDQSIVDIREDNKGIVIPGLTEMQVFNATDTIDCLVRGSLRRATASTAMNSQSSRSHAIFTLHIQQQKLNDENSLTTCKFHLVDLAGSERASKTKATGNRFKEGIKINEGLLALGNVISRLGEGNSGFIGYRDSKLTRLLQDSLGGNSVTLMIACVSPADYNLEETISTLRYADRARKIKNKPIVNRDPKAAEINRLKTLVQQLQLELLGKGGSGDNVYRDNNSELVLKLQKEVAELKQKNRQLMQSADDAVIEAACMNEKVILAEAANDRMQQKLVELKATYEQTLVELSTSGNEYRSAESTLRSIRDKIDEIQKEQKKSSEEIQEHEVSKPVSRVASKFSDLPDDTALEITESLTELDVEAKQDQHFMQQAVMTNELQQLNKELASKQALAAQVARNYQDMAEYQINIRENEDIIVKLQKERDELLQQIRNMQSSNTSTKLAEERRRRVQHLENEINDMQKKITQQAKLLKMKEKNDLRILTLNSEIQQMKASKVKLIRSMRAESESFRTWKLSRERELCKLREQDRKRANEMARMERMHGKQQNVLKRKVEEAVAINKRLKDALDKQKTAQSRRLQLGQGKAEQVRSWVEQELEVLLSTVDAERTLEQLLEDRATIQRRLEALKLQPLTLGNTDVEGKNERRRLEEDLALRSAQISDFQEKIMASDQENKSRTRWDAVQSMVEAKFALRHLFEMAADMRREVENHRAQCSDLENKQSEAHLALRRCEDKIIKLTEEHRDRTAVLEREHEEKVSVLLRQLRSTKIKVETDLENELETRIRIQERALEHMDAVQAELDDYKEQCDELKNRLQSITNVTSNRNLNVPSEEEKLCTPIKKIKRQELEYDLGVISASDTEVDVDDVVADPDYRKTPMFKRLQKTKVESKRTSTAVKRSVDGEVRCNCKGKCSNRVCSCRKMSSRCSVACKCDHATCINRSDESRGSEDNSLESSSASKKSR